MNLTDLRRKLGNGLAGQVLDQLSEAAIQGPASGKVAVARVLVSLVARELAAIWEGPVTAAQAGDLTNRFAPSLRDAVAAIEAQDETGATTAADALAQAYLSWLRGL